MTRPGRTKKFTGTGNDMMTIFDVISDKRQRVPGNVLRGIADEMIASRVAKRFLVRDSLEDRIVLGMMAGRLIRRLSKEFPNQEALNKYMKDHPDADRRNQLKMDESEEAESDEEKD